MTHFSNSLILQANINTASMQNENNILHAKAIIPIKVQVPQDQENINPKGLDHDELAAMKRNKKAERIQEFQIKREISLFPNVYLPSGSFIRENSSVKDVCNQIRQLFQIPVPAVYCSSFIHENETNHFYGLHLEYCVREAVGATNPDFTNITGRLGESNPYKEKIGFDIENELLDLKTKKEIKVVVKEEAIDEIWKFQDMFQCNYKAGDYASRMEKEWAGPIQLQELIKFKKFLKAGIYSKDYVLLELDLSREYRTSLKEDFKFPLPIEYGKQLLEESNDFDLDVQLRLFYDLTQGKKGQTPFLKIKSNIYVDRKPRKPENYPICRCVKPEDGNEMGCIDGCLNRQGYFIKLRVMMFECLPGLCNLGEKCGNQRIQLSSQDDTLQVFETPGRGYGLMTKERIKKDSFVMEYCGEVLSQQTTLERMNTVYKNMAHYYFLDYFKGEVIDGCQKGTIARFINHSCEPNCRIEKWTVGGEYRVGVFAEREILEGEELTYNYRFESFGLEQKCKCGSSTCTGVMGTLKKEETKSLKKTQRKTTLFSGFNSPLSSEFWQSKKNGKNYLESLFKDLVKLDFYYRSLRIFLIRNIRICYNLYRPRQPSIEERSKIRGTSTRQRFSGSESLYLLSHEILKRRKRPLKDIVNDLWARNN